ncbi:unnamed protein product, partial [marine sediment metagenome]
KNSAACESFEPNSTLGIDKVYNELRKELGKKRRKTKLPLYCVIDSDE